MSLQDWVFFVVSCVLLVGIVAFLVVLAVKNKWVKEVYSTVVVAIKEAEEKFPEHGSGELKKEYVLNAVEKKCYELNIPYAILKLVITKLIDTIVKHYNVIAK